MKKTKRRIITVLCTAFACAFALGFSACEEDAATPPPTDPPAQQTPEEEENGQAEIPLDKINEFIASLANDNYSFKKQIDGQTVAHYVDGNDLYIKVSDDEKYFYTYQDGQMYYFEYDQNEESWVKTKSTTLTNFDSLIYDVLNATEWKSYDKATNTVTGTCGNVEYSLNLTNGKFTGGIVGEIYNVDDTNVIIPTTYIDKTIEIDPTPSLPEDPQEPEDPTDPVEPPVSESENIYEIIGGEYVFDVVALKEVLLNWMQGDNKFDQDYMDALLCRGELTKDIIYINASKENINYGIRYKSGDKEYFVIANIINGDLYTNIQNQTIKTKDSLLAHLQTIKRAELSLKNTTYVEIDTTISATDFETLTENTFTKLEEKGTQGSSINNDFPETRLENFSDAEVLYGFKCIDSDITAGVDLGYIRGIKTYYIVNYKNNIEFINFEIYSSTSNGKNDALENILENTKYWMIGYIDREDIDDKNAELYNEAEVQTMSYDAETDILLNKKEREFF